MRTRTTERAVKNGYDFIITVQAYGLQRLLQGADSNEYTCGSCGWNSDIYDFGDVAIVTGYRTVKGNFKANYELCQKYERAAQKAIFSTYDYKKQQAKLAKLIAKFIAECKEKAAK